MFSIQVGGPLPPKVLTENFMKELAKPTGVKYLSRPGEMLSTLRLVGWQAGSLLKVIEIEKSEPITILRFSAVALFVASLVSCGTYNNTCAVHAAVLPTDVQAAHNEAPPGNQIQFAVSATSTGKCPLLVGHIGSWSTSDPENTTISNQGLATCVGATPTPATITNDGRVLGYGITSADLTCK